MKVLIDMNLSPEWVTYLENEGFEAIHWSSVGKINAKDIKITQWARESGTCVILHLPALSKSWVLTQC